MGASVPRAKKTASDLTDKELVRRLFPTPVRQELRRVVDDLNRDQKTGKKPSKAKGSSRSK
jgi:hypothetical protein